MSRKRRRRNMKFGELWARVELRIIQYAWGLSSIGYLYLGSWKPHGMVRLDEPQLCWAEVPVSATRVTFNLWDDYPNSESYFPSVPVPAVTVTPACWPEGRGFHYCLHCYKDTLFFFFLIEEQALKSSLNSLALIYYTLPWCNRRVSSNQEIFVSSATIF